MADRIVVKLVWSEFDVSLRRKDLSDIHNGFNGEDERPVPDCFIQLAKLDAVQKHLRLIPYSVFQRHSWNYTQAPGVTVESRTTLGGPRWPLLSASLRAFFLDQTTSDELGDTFPYTVAVVYDSRTVVFVSDKGKVLSVHRDSIINDYTLPNEIPAPTYAD